MTSTRESFAAPNRFMIALHPGEFLREAYFEPLGLGVGEAADKLGVTRQHLSEILYGRQAVTPAIARQLEVAFGQSDRSWLNMQRNYDLELPGRRVEGLAPQPC